MKFLLAIFASLFFALPAMAVEVTMERAKARTAGEQRAKQAGKAGTKRVLLRWMERLEGDAHYMTLRGGLVLGRPPPTASWDEATPSYIAHNMWRKLPEGKAFAWLEMVMHFEAQMKIM